jgi:hypothetical protein
LLGEWSKEAVGDALIAKILLGEWSKEAVGDALIAFSFPIDSHQFYSPFYLLDAL